MKRIDEVCNEGDDYGEDPWRLLVIEPLTFGLTDSVVSTQSRP